ncbi:MAG: glycosyltransferase family 9 protein [Flavisolibacter sp.]
MKILVRLPNWLGDMVMSVGFMHQLPHFFPGAEVSVIAKKGIHELLPFFPPVKHAFIFSKEEYKGPRGLIRFGKMIRKTERFDLFFCLPDSFSSAIMGAATGARKRVGYKNEFRQMLFTNSYRKEEYLHRARGYIQLLEDYTKKKPVTVDVSLQHHFPKKDYIVVNINSEASSRRLTLEKAVEIISWLRRQVEEKIILIGAPKEKEFVDTVFSQLPNQSEIENAAGKTSLAALVELLASARVMLSTDSGPAHLANALSTYTVVLFGAGREDHTAPFKKECRSIIRLGKLSCEPCEKNVCVRYGVPQCLERLDSNRIIDTIKLQLPDDRKKFF